MKESLHICATGDIGFHGRAGEDIAAHGAQYPFEKISGSLSRADIVIGNLEIPFVPEGARPERRDISPEFRSDPAAAGALRAAGFDIVSLANNHIMDYGIRGLETTLETLDNSGIAHTGAGMNLAEARQPAVIEKEGRRLGMLSYAMKGKHTARSETPGAAPLDEAIILEDIARLKERADDLVVSLHFGMIYTDYPKREHQKLSRKIIDAGANAVLGHHPHLIQGIEDYGDGIIAYSLGEILFDPSSGYVEASHVEDLRRQSMILELIISNEGTVATVLPVCTGEDLRPGLCGEEMENMILTRLQAISSVLPGYDIDFDRHLARRTTGHETRVLMYNLRRLNFGYAVKKLTKLRFSHIRSLFRK